MILTVEFFIGETTFIFSEQFVGEAAAQRSSGREPIKPITSQRSKQQQHFFTNESEQLLPFPLA